MDTYLFNVPFMAGSPWQLASSEHTGRTSWCRQVVKGESGNSRVLRVLDPVLVLQWMRQKPQESLGHPGWACHSTPLCLCSLLRWPHLVLFGTWMLLISLIPHHLFISIWFSATELCESSTHSLDVSGLASELCPHHVLALTPYVLV